MFRTDVMQAGLNPRTHTIAGTPWYMAPEVIQSDTHDYGTSRSEDVSTLIPLRTRVGYLVVGLHSVADGQRTAAVHGDPRLQVNLMSMLCCSWFHRHG
jgi:serine/threonine protein kinase